jgi:tetraacyldisaccharide 4'-kinase
VKGLRGAVERSWSGESGPWNAPLAVLTTPLSWIWGGVTAVRNRRHDRRPAARVEGVRVVSVGNLAVGGTGKTPVAAWVVEWLAQRGARPGIVVSGYGADELLLHRRWHPEVPIFADRDRRSAVVLTRDAGARVVVLDDGFQHRAVGRDLDIVLLAAEHPFPGRLMPRGPYREPSTALRRADVVLITRRTAEDQAVDRIAREVARVAPGAETGVLALRPGRWCDVGGAWAEPPEGPLLAVSSVARPGTFLAAVRAAVGEGTDVRAHGFPDHHDYSDEDVRLIAAEAEREGRTIVATEKDAVKLAGLPATPSSVRILCSHIEWDRGLEDIERCLSDLAEVGDR